MGGYELTFSVDFTPSGKLPLATRIENFPLLDKTKWVAQMVTPITQ
jgi:hypothetical protein